VEQRLPLRAFGQSLRPRLIDQFAQIFVRQGRRGATEKDEDEEKTGYDVEAHAKTG
jgi:hypothetical protein